MNLNLYCPPLFYLGKSLQIAEYLEKVAIIGRCV